MRHAVALAALLGCAACGKELNPKFCAAHPDDERCAGAGVDARTGGTSQVPVEHVPVDTELMLTSDVDITVDSPGVVIDTAAGTITPEWSGAVVLASVAQDDGSNVMVVQVGSLTVDAAADTIDVDGDKPLVIVATRTISIAARIDASADGLLPGPGGYASGLGPGAGTEGGAAGNTGDGGGGGGSYGATGGRGGNPQAGMAGPTYGSAMRLEGGSGGGVPSMPGSTCVIEAGAGGGALQLTALVSITIDGNINVGGSGGEGGEFCGSDGSGGGGGGSGGMVFLESPTLLGSGNLGALGGGGGEAANSIGGTGVPGGDAGTTTPGTGGVSGNTGGDGGTASADGTTGNQGADGSTSEGNGGGGAGGGGRIYYKTTGPQPSITARPAAADA